MWGFRFLQLFFKFEKFSGHTSSDPQERALQNVAWGTESYRENHSPAKVELSSACCLVGGVFLPWYSMGTCSGTFLGTYYIWLLEWDYILCKLKKKQVNPSLLSFSWSSTLFLKVHLSHVFMNKAIQQMGFSQDKLWLIQKMVNVPC